MMENKVRIGGHISNDKVRQSEHESAGQMRNAHDRNKDRNKVSFQDEAGNEVFHPCLWCQHCFCFLRFAVGLFGFAKYYPVNIDDSITKNTWNKLEQEIYIYIYNIYATITDSF